MTTLADGAVELAPAHLSARVAWHDTDWTGRVCAAPGANHSCTVLTNVKEGKNVDAEEEDAGAPWSELSRESAALRLGRSGRCDRPDLGVRRLR
jgi:hypothetical protein